MYKVKRSPIHGRGLFATTKIARGTPIGVYEGPQTNRDSTYVLWVTGDDGIERGILGQNALRFVNHSTSPNAEFAGPELVSLKTIQPGAEITCHYGEEWEGMPLARQEA